MTTPSALPDDLVNGYWEVVAEELCDLGLGEADATAAAAGYRAYMAPAGDTIYNDKTAETARHAKSWFERHVRPNGARPRTGRKSRKARPA